MVQSIGEEIRVLVITKRNIEKDLLDLEAELLEIETVELPIYTQGFNNAQKDHYERMQISRENYAYEAKCKEIQEEIDKLEAISKKIKAKALRNSRSTKPTPSKKTKKEKLEERATQILVNLYCGRPSNYVSTI
jgi:predicted RNase H-like nuclease (RuvC/YqgF family)